MDGESQRILEYLTEVEEAAEDVLTTKQQVTKSLLARNHMLLLSASVTLENPYVALTS